MILVIDANPFIAGFLRNSGSRLIILSGKVRLYSPDWIEQEFNRNEKELVKKFSDTSKFSETKRLLFTFLNIIPHSEYSPYIKEASNLTKHTKDIPYFALALYLNCAIWSEERSFKKQSKVKVYSTSELLEEVGLK